MFNLMDYKQGEEIKERLDRLEKKMDEVKSLLIRMDEVGGVKLDALSDSLTPILKPTPKKKGK